MTVAGALFDVILATLFLLAGMWLQRWQDKPKPIYWTKRDWGLSSQHTLSATPSDQLDQSGTTRTGTTRIGFWNQGSSTIRGSDMSTKYPLTVVLAEGTIASAMILRQTTEGITPRAIMSDDRRSLSISFAYLNQGDGLLLEVQFGPFNVQKIDCVGEFAGFGHIKEIKTKPWSTKSRLKYEIKLGATAMLVMLALGIVGLVSSDLWQDSSAVSIYGGACLLFLTYLVLATKKQYTPAMPDELSVYDKWQ